METIPDEVEYGDEIIPDILDAYPRVTEQLHHILDVAVAVFVIKNNQYGNGIRYTGLLGSAVEVFGAAMRIPFLIIRASDHGLTNKRKIRGILGDILIYTAISIMHIDNNNWEGEL
jgi:hypothetical protein